MPDAGFGKAFVESDVPFINASAGQMVCGLPTPVFSSDGVVKNEKQTYFSLLNSRSLNGGI